MYLVQGDPGVGKTTLALQFLLEGVRVGERGLYVTLSETRDELHAAARAHGWSLEQLSIYEMAVGEGGESQDEENTLYIPAEVELGERIKALLVEVDRVKPSRIVIDSCSELRLLAHSSLRFRRQLLALKDQLVRRRVTVLLIDNPATDDGDRLLQSLVHGVIKLEQLSPLYGAERRRLRVQKLREVAFRGGYHDMTIKKEGVVVYPRLVANEHHEPFKQEMVSSGVAEIDALLGGGLDRGTSSLFVGPPGSGKSALSSLYAHAAAARGERVAMFTFDESTGTLFARARAVGLDLEGQARAGRVLVQQIDPAELSPGAFVSIIRREVEQEGCKLVVLDSLNGYLQAMPEEKFLSAQLHELLSYLRQQGVVTVMVLAQQGVLGAMSAPIDVSYLADTVLMLRFFEARGRVCKAISVLKKRTGPHEDTIRAFSLGQQGFVVGPPLTRFQGVLTGVPLIDGWGDGSERDGNRT
jgi:circadian clock protein KaiC